MRIRLLFSIVAAAGLFGCKDGPVPTGVAAVSKVSLVDQGKANDLAQNRELCAMHGDDNCREVLEEIQGKNAPDYRTWFDDIWTGTPKNVPESVPARRH